MPLRIHYDEEGRRHRDQYGGRVSSVTQILGVAGIGGYDLYRILQATAPEELAAAADRGRKVHLATEQLDNGLLDRDNLDPAIEPHIIAYQKWLERTGFCPLLIEQIVYHEHFRYIGRLDRMGMIGGQKWLVDIKTGKLLEAHDYQTAAYLATFHEPLTYERMILQLCDDGTFKIHTPPKSKFYSDLQIFLAALEAHRDEIEGRV